VINRHAEMQGNACKSRSVGRRLTGLQCLFAFVQQIPLGLPDSPTVCLCRSQPAGDLWGQTCITACKKSLAGQLLQGEIQAHE
ncbi:hypothetical protein, partial [Limnohabitans sp. Rim8]|uniref:hypothetical protein n=1 Tax=Limnohabitans sp. Rim8 TaxID=1100718 RepID=UPI00330662B2